MLTRSLYLTIFLCLGDLLSLGGFFSEGLSGCSEIRLVIPTATEIKGATETQADRGSAPAGFILAPDPLQFVN